MRKIVAALALTAMTVGMVQLAGAGEEKDLIETMTTAGQFSTLLKAAAEAGLTETLKGEGPYTVFAPSDQAFARLPEGTLDSLLKDKTRLKAVLSYHIIPGRVPAADMAKLESTKTLDGRNLTVSTSDGQVVVNKAKVVRPDIKCANGIIHVIDAVCLPPSE
jgi:uncharacterized surface protein with fasciclin (FAS1) repeats